MSRFGEQRNLQRLAWAISLAALVSCGGPTLVTPGASGNKPTVIVQSPVNGTQVAAGATVTVAGSATDSIGVAQVILFVDGVSAATAQSGQPTPTTSFALTWAATTAGSHTLQVFAYRADGTSSDPAVVQVVVGPGVSGLLSGSPGASLLPLPSLPPLVSSNPTKKPRASSIPTLPPTPAPSLPQTSPPTPTPTATASSTPTPVPVPTIPPGGLAPDDTALEPHQIGLSDCSVQICPPGVLAMGSVTEQISAPGGDVTDRLYFVPEASRSYKIELTLCSDVSDGTVWKPTASNDTLVTGCGDWLVLQFSSSPPAQSFIDVTYAAVSGQMYNAYVYTVYLLDQ
jgi:hypothetical protein